MKRRELLFSACKRVRKKLNGKGIGEIAPKGLALPAGPGSPINNCGDLGSVARKGVKEQEAGKC